MSRCSSQFVIGGIGFSPRLKDREQHRKKKIVLTTAYVLWNIWNERNRIFFQDTMLSTDEIVHVGLKMSFYT
jgi:hypothetical protein